MTPADFGPLYYETDMTRFPVEPWNAASNLIFLGIFIYFCVRLRGTSKRHAMLTLCLPLLLIGWLGGTVFHATRSHNLWLYLDFTPIFVLVISASVYLWMRIIERKWLVIVCAAAPIILVRILRMSISLPRVYSISLGYFGLGLVLMIPACAHCFKNRGAHGIYLITAFVVFMLALYFRSVDHFGLLPMGTHFLWHLLGGVSTLLLMQYIYLDGEKS